MTTAQDILAFWFSDNAKDHWWQSSDAFDAQLKEQFGELAERAANGELSSWADDAESCLALIILLDQLPRNIYRGSAKAFAADGLARYYTMHAIKRGFDHRLPTIDHKLFLYLPLEHSESLEDQKLCLNLMATHTNDAYTSFARRHLDIIQRFSRFPHRNKVLGRINTPEEDIFLSGPQSGF
jgi:uncharacterized protein (DUF924 family)